MPALQLAQEREQGCDLAAGILVDAVQAHERVEDQQARLQRGHRLGETPAVGLHIQPERRRGDNKDIEVGQLGAGSDADALQAPSHDVERVLGGVEQDSARARHHEASQAGDAGGDRDGDVESEERLAALGLSRSMRRSSARSAPAVRRDVTRRRLSRPFAFMKRRSVS